MISPVSKLTLVHVIWYDAFTSDTAWVNIEAVQQGMKEYEAYECHTVGYIVSETDDYITLAQTVDKDCLQGESNGKLNALMHIPK